ncbi:MAG: hypothetical protein HY294_07880 [Candidatus Rokubacteria bacterium]|nr:hypothetical protein [Candidatus Rokubacteria bacterium]
MDLMIPIEARAALAGLWSLAGGDPAALEQVNLSSSDPVLPGRSTSRP